MKENYNFVQTEWMNFSSWRGEQKKMFLNLQLENYKVGCIFHKRDKGINL